MQNDSLITKKWIKVDNESRIPIWRPRLFSGADIKVRHSRKARSYCLATVGELMKE